MGGEASMRFCLDAIDAANRKLVDAVVTAPIAKESWKLAGYHYPGHTELFAQRTGARRYAMMFAGGPLKVVLATVHIPLMGLWGRLNIGAVFQPIELVHQAMVEWFDIAQAAHRRVRREPARQRERPVRRRGRTHHLPRHLDGPRAGHRRHRPLSARHDFPRRPRRAIRCRRRDVSRPGTDPGEAAGVRPGGERDARPADHPHQPRSRHRVRHRRPQPRQPRHRMRAAIELAIDLAVRKHAREEARARTAPPTTP